MRFQKANFSDYLNAAPVPEPADEGTDGPEAAPAIPETVVAAPNPYDALEADAVAARLESLCAARRTASGEDAQRPASSPSPAPQHYDLIPPSRGRKRRSRSS